MRERYGWNKLALYALGLSGNYKETGVIGRDDFWKGNSRHSVTALSSSTLLKQFDFQHALPFFDRSNIYSRKTKFNCSLVLKFVLFRTMLENLVAELSTKEVSS